MRHHFMSWFTGSVLAFAAAAQPAAAQPAPNPVTGAIGDLGHIATSPSRMDSSDAYRLAAIIGAGALFYSLDGNIRSEVLRNHTSALNHLSDKIQNLGNGGVDIAITGAGWLAGKAFSDDKLSRTSLLAAESFLAANGVGSVAKIVIGRSRPYTGDGKGTFHPFTLKSSRMSFPSGHTTSAFSVASVYAYCYSDSPAVVFSAYSLAGLVAPQRVYANKHWTSDVFFGSVLGTAVGRMVAAKGMEKPGATALLPVIGPGYSGMEAKFSF